MNNDPEIAVIIPSRGRPAVLTETVRSVARQTVYPGQIILSVTSAGDFEESVRQFPGVSICMGSPGITVQRNRATHLLSDTVQYVSFLDDDVEIATDYLALVKEVFHVEKDLVAFEGEIIINGGIDRVTAQELLVDRDRNVRPVTRRVQWVTRGGLLGGCLNARKHLFQSVVFDERLPLYAWLEDSDFGIRARRIGKIGHSPVCRLIHLAVPGGRILSAQFGFAQIMNPVYLAAKGVLGWREVLCKHVLKVVLANLYGCLTGDPKVDRRGRLRGNWIAFQNVFAKRIRPEDMMDITS